MRISDWSSDVCSSDLTGNPMFGPCINQISFRMASIADLRDMHGRLKAAGYTDEQMLCGNHGNGWSIYFPDPAGKLLECFVDSEWYVDQPVATPRDFSQSDEQILPQPKATVEQQHGFEPIAYLPNP